jgi:hypothetical protein
MQPSSNDRANRIDARVEEPLELVALGEVERRQTLGRRVGLAELGRERAKPGGRARGVAPRPDHVSEQDDAVHPRRLIGRTLIVND